LPFKSHACDGNACGGGLGLDFTRAAGFAVGVAFGRDKLCPGGVPDIQGVGTDMSADWPAANTGASVQ
jgi:hypothetical protein